jgi:TetR/AcrR family transcriptional regulator, fatty acid metabolism regulator protein
MASKRLNSKKRREEILNIALKIIYEEGFYNLTIRNIAERTNISEAALYRHFKNKKEIIDNLANLIFQSERFQFAEINKVDPVKLLESIIFEQMKEFEKNPYITAITFQEEIFREYPDIREKFNKHRKEREVFFSNIITLNQNKGLISKNVDPEAFALLFMGGIRMSVLKWKSADFSFSLGNEAIKVIRELFRLLIKE